MIRRGSRTMAQRVSCQAYCLPQSLRAAWEQLLPLAQRKSQAGERRRSGTVLHLTNNEIENGIETETETGIENGPAIMIRTVTQDGCEITSTPETHHLKKVDECMSSLGIHHPRKVDGRMVRMIVICLQSQWSEQQLLRHLLPNITMQMKNIDAVCNKPSRRHTAPGLNHRLLLLSLCRTHIGIRIITEENATTDQTTGTVRTTRHFRVPLGARAPTQRIEEVPQRLVRTERCPLTLATMFAIQETRDNPESVSWSHLRKAAINQRAFLRSLKNSSRRIPIQYVRALLPLRM